MIDNRILRYLEKPCFKIFGLLRLRQPGVRFEIHILEDVFGGEMIGDTSADVAPKI